MLQSVYTNEGSYIAQVHLVLRAGWALLLPTFDR